MSTESRLKLALRSVARGAAQAAPVAYLLLSFFFATSLLWISLDLPPMIVERWVRLGLRILLVVIGARILFEGLTLLDRAPQPRGRHSRASVTGHLLRFCLTVALAYLALWQSPFWLEPWKWNVVRLLACLVAASALARLLAFLWDAYWREEKNGRGDWI